MERGVLGRGGDIPIWPVGRHLWRRGSFPIIANRLQLQAFLPLNMRAAIPKKSLGRHEESRTASLPGGGREGETIRAHPVPSLTRRSSEVRAVS